VSVNCRLCGTVPEYVDHLLSSYTPLAATMYKQRHDTVASIVHWSLLKRYNLSVPPNYWNHTPAASYCDSPDVKVLWDFNHSRFATRLRDKLLTVNKQPSLTTFGVLTNR